ncbi:uncharacterized protein LOC114239564 [Bombyx mandarina]|uniref:Uncharacterized protein LOC114239564 n=1 Tax=Bombyx mandarina TaxID=7092 RepID=A0A6J2J893_BOMMA|nr:uncharacterized protein LOC114239564 [Bombyx mandarina]
MMNAKIQAHKIRCTRRFSPGTCMKAVEPMWTYVLRTQNCIPRLGCPTERRSNRFRSFESCIICRSLLQLMVYFAKFDSLNISSRWDSLDLRAHHHGTAGSIKDFNITISDEDYYSPEDYATLREYRSDEFVGPIPKIDHDFSDEHLDDVA